MSAFETLKTILEDSKISNEEKLKFFLQTDGKVSSSKIRFVSSIIKNYPFYTWLLNTTKELDNFSSDITTSMRISYLTDKENSKIEYCKKCGKPALCFKRLQKRFASCKHKKSFIDHHKLVKDRVKKELEMFLKTLEIESLFLSNEEYKKKFLEQQNKANANSNYRFPITSKENIAFYHDLILRTKNIVPIDIKDLRISERYYLLSNNLKSIPKCRLCGENEVKFINRIAGYNKTCKKCYKSLTREKRKILNKKKIDALIDTSKYEIIEYPKIVTEEPIKIRCKKCRKISETWIDNGRLSSLNKVYLCKHCEQNHSEENSVYDFVSSIYLKQIIHQDKGRTIIPPYELDIYVPEKKLGIEFDGLYWHAEERGKNSLYHLRKTDLCEKKGIQLIHIFEDEWFYKQDIVKSRLKNLLGIYDNKCFARQCIVKEISSKEAFAFQEANHIQGAVNSKVNLGLYFNNELISLMTFSKPRFDKKHEWELVRFCNKLGWHIPGAASKLLSYFEKKFRPKNIVSYADRRWSKGNLYKQTGFELDHISSPDYWYIRDGIRYSRIRFQKHKLSKMFVDFDPKLSEKENVLSHGYSRIWDCGNLVFVKHYA